MSGDPGIDDREFVEIQRFLTREAACLDRRDYAAWLGLLADDIVYRVSSRVVRDMEGGERDTAIVDEDAVALRARVDQLRSPRLTHAENPASFTRRFVSNLDAQRTVAGEYAVVSNLLVFRSRTNVPQGGFYVGERHDVLRRADGGLRLARRDVRLDQSTFFDGVVSLLF
jgi:3-phenylpropionate/cinnamic acid dioxygenase small subunit